MTRTLFGWEPSSLTNLLNVGLVQCDRPGSGGAPTRQTGWWVPEPERRVLAALDSFRRLGGLRPRRGNALGSAADRVAQAARTYEPGTLVDLTTMEPITDGATWVAERPPTIALILRVPEPAK